MSMQSQNFTKLMGLRVWANARKKIATVQENRLAHSLSRETSSLRSTRSGRDSYLVTNASHTSLGRPHQQSITQASVYEPIARPSAKSAPDARRSQQVTLSAAQGGAKAKSRPFEQMVAAVFAVKVWTSDVEMEAADVERLLAIGLSDAQMKDFLRGLCEPALPNDVACTAHPVYAVNVYIPSEVQEYLFSRLLSCGYEQSLKYMVIRTKAEQVTREAMHAAIRRSHVQPVMVEPPANTEEAWSPLFLARLEPDRDSFPTMAPEFIYVEYLMPTVPDGPVENTRIYKGTLSAMVELEQTQPVKTTSASSIYYLDTTEGQLLIDTASVRDWGVSADSSGLPFRPVTQHSLAASASAMRARRDLPFGGEDGLGNGLADDHWYEPVDPGHLNRFRGFNGAKASLTLFDARRYSQEINGYIDRTPFDPWA